VWSRAHSSCVVQRQPDHYAGNRNCDASELFKTPKIHHFYSNDESHFQCIADGPNLIVEPRDATRDEFRLYRNVRTPENLLIVYDYVTQAWTRSRE